MRDTCFISTIIDYLANWKEHMYTYCNLIKYVTCKNLIWNVNREKAEMLHPAAYVLDVTIKK